MDSPNRKASINTSRKLPAAPIKATEHDEQNKVTIAARLRPSRSTNQPPMRLKHKPAIKNKSWLRPNCSRDAWKSRLKIGKVTGRHWLTDPYTKLRARMNQNA